MKIIFRSAVIAALILATSCGKDTAENVAEEFENEAEQQEQTPLEANDVSNNVIIEGGTKQEGMPPTPNEAISLDISNTGKTAFLNEGFEIKLSSEAEIVGAYVQFKTNDGVVSDSYYDVNIATNTEFDIDSKSSKDFILQKKKVSSLSAKDDEEITIDIDFNANIEPGTFCYVVCVYDGEGNISAPSEVCATVESWGGNASLVAEWSIVKTEDTYDGQTTVRVLGEEDCTESGSFSTTCNEEVKTFYECETLEIADLTFNADGTYYYKDQSKRKELDTEATQEACEAVYYEDAITTDVYESRGNWAYVDDESRLTLVEYSYSETENGVLSESETLEPGEGELIFDGEIILDGNTFTVSEEFDNDNDGTIDESYTSYLEK